MDLSGPVAAFEVFLDNVPEPRTKKGAARPHIKLSPYKKVARDFSFVVDDTVTAQDVVGAVSGADKKLITDVAVFDIGAEIIGPGPRPVVRLVGQAFAVAAAVVIGAQA